MLLLVLHPATEKASQFYADLVAEERALRVDRNEGMERARLLDDRPAPGVVGLGDIVNVAGRGRRHSVGQEAAVPQRLGHLDRRLAALAASVFVLLEVEARVLQEELIAAPRGSPEREKLKKRIDDLDAKIKNANRPASE